MLENQLATIEFDFLEQQESVESWNNSLFYIFKWLDKMEELLVKNHLRVMILNDEQIFSKFLNEERIGIFHNPFLLKPEKNQQLLVILTDKEIENAQTEIIDFKNSLLKFLKFSEIKHSVLDTKNNGFPGNPVGLKYIIEISISA